MSDRIGCAWLRRGLPGANLTRPRLRRWIATVGIAATAASTAGCGLIALRPGYGPVVSGVVGDMDGVLEDQLKTIAVSGDLAGKNLAGANLAGVDLADKNLAGANLVGAELGGANLGGANLAGANLAGANLAGANLAGANLAGAERTDADRWVANARVGPDTSIPTKTATSPRPTPLGSPRDAQPLQLPRYGVNDIDGALDPVELAELNRSIEQLRPLIDLRVVYANDVGQAMGGKEDAAGNITDRWSTIWVVDPPGNYRSVAEEHYGRWRLTSDRNETFSEYASPRPFVFVVQTTADGDNSTYYLLGPDSNSRLLCGWGVTSSLEFCSSDVVPALQTGNWAVAAAAVVRGLQDCCGQRRR